MRATFLLVRSVEPSQGVQIIANSKNAKKCLCALGYFGFEGNHDSCIAIRTARLTGGNIHYKPVQAGVDSVPENEYQETINKAKGMLKAIAMAEISLPIARSKALNLPILMQQAPEQSSLDIYMQQISDIPLLTVQDEIDLAARIAKGDTEAREIMITSNLRLVVKIAQEYSNLGLSVLDLINEGNMGLMKAVERFDPSKGGKLSTYASWWIKQAIKRALANQSKTIRLPVHMVDG